MLTIPDTLWSAWTKIYRLLCRALHKIIVQTEIKVCKNKVKGGIGNGKQE